MAIVFDGSQYLNCLSDSTLDNISAKSIVTWLRLDAGSATQRICQKGATASGNIGWYAGITSTNVLIYAHSWTTVGQWGGSSALSTGVLYHVAILYDRSSTSNDPVIYLDGSTYTISEVSTPAGTVGDDNTAALRVASNQAGANAMTGMLEDFRIINRIISQREVQLLVGGFRGPLGGEVLWLPMLGAQGLGGQFDGASLTASTNYISDVSGNRNHGDPGNGATGLASELLRAGAWAL